MAPTLAFIVGTASLLAATSAQDGGSVTGAAILDAMEGAFTKPHAEFTETVSGCSALMKGCTGTLVTLGHEVAGTVTVEDDCTFFVDGWQFDGEGPAVEWWGAKRSAAPPPGRNPYIARYITNAKKIGELGAPGSYQTGSKHGGDSEIVVRLGKDAAGEQILLSEDLDHVLVTCESCTVDFGSAALQCDGAGRRAMLQTDAAAPAAATSTAAPTGAPATPQVDVDENTPDEVPVTDDVLGDSGANDVAEPGEFEDGAERTHRAAAAALAGTAALVAWLV